MSGALTGPNSRPTWKPKFHSTRNCIIVWISIRVLRTSPAPFLGLWKLPLLSVARLETRPQIPAGIQDEIRLKNRLWRRRQVTRDPALKAEVNRLQRSVTRRFNEWRNNQWSATLESLNPEDQSLWKMTKRVMRVPTLSLLLVTPRGLALPDSQKAEALAFSLEAQFQPVTVPSVPAVIETVDVAL